MKKKITTILKCASSVCLACILLLVSCSGGGSASSGAQGEPKAAAPAPKKDLVLGTAGTSGVYYIVGAALSKVVNDASGSINLIAQASKGSGENLNLVMSGEMDFGMANSDSLYYANTGTGPYQKSGALKEIRAVMALYLSCAQMVARADSGIKTYADLKGKRISLGVPNTTMIDNSSAILRAYGIDAKKDITPYYLSIEEGCQKVQDGDIDATFFMAATPAAGVMNIATTSKIVMVDADPAMLDKVIKELPYMSQHIIPAGTYKGVDTDTHTLKLMTNFFCRADMSEDVVYELINQVLANVNKALNSHEVIAQIGPQNATVLPIEMHPGAVKYFKEHGLIK
jgi:TRAP transporter TAXI family solute receptor